MATETGAGRRRAEVVTSLPLMRRMSDHYAEVPFLLTAEMFGGIPIEIAGAEIVDLVDRPVAGLHSHDVDEIYLIVSRRPGDAVVEVEVEGERLEVTAPAAVHLPAGARHQFVTRRAEPGSFMFGILLVGPFREP